MEAYWGAAAEASKLAAHDDAGRSPPASQATKKAKAADGAAATKASARDLDAGLEAYWGAAPPRVTEEV